MQSKCIGELHMAGTGNNYILLHGVSQTDAVETIINACIASFSLVKMAVILSLGQNRCVTAFSGTVHLADEKSP